MKKVLLVDADSKIPNIALMKLSAFYKDKGWKVDFKRLNMKFRFGRNHFHFINGDDYDEAFCSVVFENSMRFLRRSRNVVFGGTGYSLDVELPKEVEAMHLDYSLYPDNTKSYGFITRGCIRNCEFCKVPKKEGKTHQVGTVKEIVKHDKVRFLDNNILSFKGHKAIFEELIEKNIACSFNEGLDIRLVTKENSLLLSKLNYYPGKYMFAFDNINLLETIKRKLELLDWRKKDQIRFYVYVHPDMPISDTTRRLEFIRENDCLPYLMRHENCWDSAYHSFYSLLSKWANWVPYFKMMTFHETLVHDYGEGSPKVDYFSGLYSGRIKRDKERLISPEQKMLEGFGLKKSSDDKIAVNKRRKLKHRRST